MMRLHTREEGGNAAINLTPLIDIVFILLIFFAVNSTFVKFPGVEVDQPVARSTVVQQSATILIAVTDTGEVWIDRDQVDIRRLRGVIERMFVETPDASVWYFPTRIPALESWLKSLTRPGSPAQTKLPLPPQWPIRNWVSETGHSHSGPGYQCGQCSSDEQHGLPGPGACG